MPDARAVVIPQTPLLRAEPLRFQQRAQTPALQRINQSPRLLPSANARDRQRHVLLLSGPAPNHAAEGRPVAPSLPGMSLLRANFLLAKRVPVCALHRTRLPC